jgi:two-component system, NarL family, response regulator NreC
MTAHLHLVSAPSGSRSAPAPGGSIRVVLGEKHANMRRSLRLLLDGEQDVEVISEAGDLSTVMHHVHGHRPHVLVLDLGMQNGSSLEAIRRLRQQAPGPGIVVLTMEESPRFAQQAIDAGAVGYVLKDRADRELPDAVRSAARSEEYVSPYVAAGLESLRRTAAVTV